MRLRRSILALLAGSALAVLAPAAAPASAVPIAGDSPVGQSGDRPGPSGDHSGPSGDRSGPPVGQPGDRDGSPVGQPGDRPGSSCQPGTSEAAPATTVFYQGQEFLGPQQLPGTPPVGPLLKGYERFGDLTEAEFLATYRSGGAYIYPPKDGFVLDDAGEPIRYPERLRPGTRVDRFGYPGGAYLAPVGTPYAERALPPQNLNTPANAPQSNYHVYCVVRPFTVAAGPIAPWFGQPGLGAQYKLDPTYLPEAGTELSVDWLVRHDYLVEERPGAQAEQRCDSALEFLHLAAC